MTTAHMRCCGPFACLRLALPVGGALAPLLVSSLWCGRTLGRAFRSIFCMPPPGNHSTPIPCNTRVCSIDAVCCGFDETEDAYFCASHCGCFNTSGIGPGCYCDPGFHGIDCAQQISPTVWLAVILSVGTLLVLLIAWGFRCQDTLDFTEFDDPHDPRRNNRAPLLREGSDRAAAAARPPTVRESEPPSAASESNSCLGAGTSVEPSMQRRVCCVCLSKPLQVVLIPCGHACVCRRCSRKLDKCPLCRLDIQATQRFYF